MQPTEAAKILNEVLNASARKGVFEDLQSAAVTYEALKILVNAANTPMPAKKDEQ